MKKRKIGHYPAKAVLGVLALTVFLAFPFSCTGKKAPGDKEKKVVICSFYPVYIMAKNVAAGVPGVELRNLTPFAAGCLHDYSLTPADRLSLDKAGALIVNGYGMESFLDKLVSQYPSLKIIQSARGIEPLVDKKNGQTNAHVWVSVGNAIQQVRNIAEGLAGHDPVNAALYRRNASGYIRSLETLRAKMHAGLKDRNGRPIVTFHEAFPYFAREFDLTIAAVVEREPGSEPGAREMADTVKLIKNLKVKAIFAEPQYSPKAARTIGDETGVPVYYLDPAVTGPDTADSYVRIMESNLTVLREALQ